MHSPFLLPFPSSSRPNIMPQFQRRRLVGDSGTVLRREVRGSDGRTGERGDEDEGEAGEEFGEETFSSIQSGPEGNLPEVYSYRQVSTTILHCKANSSK